MASRSIAQVNIIFGMVSVCVKLYISASAEQVSFNMINPKTGNRIKQKLIDAVTEEEINRNETVKGYEYQKDKFITFTEEEIKNIQAEKKDTLDIVEFVPLNEIDPLHVEKTFYTKPEKGMDRPYQLLYQILKKENKVAVGIWVSNGKENLVTIRSYRNGLIMHQMFYNSEMRPFEDTFDNIVLTQAELSMGKMLIDQFSNKTFDKSKYSDKFLEKLKKVIENKLSQTSSSTEVSASLYSSLVSIGVPTDQINKAITRKNRTKKLANT